MQTRTLPLESLKKRLRPAAFLLPCMLLASSAFLFSCNVLASSPAVAMGGTDAAVGYLGQVMDAYYKTLDVYTDLAAAGNHFPYLAATSGSPEDSSGVRMDEAWTRDCHSGSTCIKNTFRAVSTTYWGGWYFMNGVLLNGETQPRANWGAYPNAGFDLRGATRITFWARGKNGGEKIEFFAGGVGRDAASGKPLKATHWYPDSLPRVPRRGTVTTLTKAWRRYTITLTGRNLRYVIGGFGWVANARKNPKGATFYLDDVRYDKTRPSALRFLVSYHTLPAPVGGNFDTVFKNVAYTYDNVVALLAFLRDGHPDGKRRAALLADALVYALHHDRYYDDGRLRNAYQGGDLIIPPGWTPNDRQNTARLPAWWDARTKTWLEDADQVGTSTGNMAWAMLGLLQAHQVIGKSQYLEAAKKIGMWIESNTRDTRGAGGYTGGFSGWEPNPTRLLWKSTEHNIDVYVAFMTLSDLSQEPDKSTWREWALHAKSFVRAMWGACGADHSAAGTTDDGVTPNGTFAPEDVNTWGLMALGETTTYGAGIDWVLTNCGVNNQPCPVRLFSGIDFNSDKDGIWWEGTAHTVIAERIKGDDADADMLLANLVAAQRWASNGNGRGIVASCRDGVTTGMANSLLYDRLHTAATAWYVLAELKCNPYWGIPTSAVIPHQGE